MFSRYLTFSTVCVFVVFTKVVNSSTDGSCEVESGPTKGNENKYKKKVKGPDDWSDIKTSTNLGKCMPAMSSSCKECVASSYKLVSIVYSSESDGGDTKWEKKFYNITACKCVDKKKILNAVVDDKAASVKSYMYEYRMMSYTTYVLAAVCAILGLIIISLCLRYEVCRSKNKKREKAGENGQHKPLYRAQTSNEDKV